MARLGWFKSISVAMAIVCAPACSSSSGADRCAAGNCTATPAAGIPTGNRAGDGAAPPTSSGDFGNPTGLTPTITPTQPPPSTPQAGSAANPNAGTSAPVATPDREPVKLDECGMGNPAGLDAQTVNMLTAGGAASGARWLYPYNRTVFPRGMLAPTLMWDGAPGDIVYVRISARLFEYRGCLRVTGPQQLQLPQEVWKKAGDQTLGPVDPYTVEVTVLGSRGAIGPLRTEIVIAQATLKGSIFYNSYVSPNAFGGSVYRIPPGGKSEVFLGGNLGCFGCHSLSANGTHLVASSGGDPGASYTLSPTTTPNPPMTAVAPLPSFVGVSPDGSVYVNTALPAMGARPTTSPIEAFLVTEALLHETSSGTLLTGSGLAPGAMMPTFSPDGSLLVFNDAAAGGGPTLALMAYDGASRKFSDRRVIYEDGGQQYPGWPFLLPDNQAVIFARGKSPGFAADGAGVIAGGALLGLLPGPASDLYIVDVESKKSTILARAMGMNSPDDPASYTPFGDQDLHKHYFPTVSPVSAGGYFWIFFDSIRNYGNLGAARQLWGSAITVSADGRYEADPSHPAFYVTGQEFGTGNHRAFTALDPCKKDGDACETGIDCCSGFCTAGKCGLPPPPPPGDPPRCSKTDEACKSTADCCNPTDLCLNGFCGQVILL